MRFSITTSGPVVDLAFDDGGMNLLSSDALRELRTTLSSVAGDTRVLVFRSARARLFAAGADMEEMKAFSSDDASEFSLLGQDLFDAIERLKCITVAAIDGDCFGGALDLVMAFDLRLATPRSRFSHPGSRLGIVTGFGGTSRWRKLLTRAAATQLLLANRIFGAEEAQELGLVDEVTESPLEAVPRLASLDPSAVQMVKELTNCHARLSRSELLLVARRLGGIYFA